VESDEVEGDSAVDVFQVGLGQAAVATMVQVGDGNGLADGSFDPRT
jgi:hypothetical protein